MRVRIRFEKTGVMRYVGHLDLMRFFQKAVKRADLDIKYSEGFNPHQIMSFALPLGVGLTSVGEYMDIDIKTEIPSSEGIKRLNENMVEGLKVVSFKYLPDNALKCMTAVTAAHYRVSYKDPSDDIVYVDNLKELKDSFYDKADAINIIKETKKGERALDLKPLVYDFDLDFDGRVPVYDLYVSCGSTDNIKPALVIKPFYETCNLGEFNENSLDIMRVDMYTGEPNHLISLGSIGDDK